MNKGKLQSAAGFAAFRAGLSLAASGTLAVGMILAAAGCRKHQRELEYLSGLKTPGREAAAAAKDSAPPRQGSDGQRAGATAEQAAAAMAGEQAGHWLSADIATGVKLELCGIPAGKFTMGGEGKDETKHEVTLTKAFWLGCTEVTQAQWEAVMGGNPSHFKGKDLPVDSVCWKDATEFCGKLNAKDLLPEGWKWALPTEAQWEYACRAGTAGDYAGALDEMAWYEENSGLKTHPVATKKANAWGLHDMHGNACEWCADWYADYPTGSVTDPAGPANGSDRVFRGGCWSSGSDCRSADRYWYPPDIRDRDLGFRVAAVRMGK